MARFYLTNKAVSDLESIWNYTVETWSEKQAETYYIQLMDSFQNLAENQDIGKSYSEVKESLFGFLSGKHIIFYE